MSPPLRGNEAPPRRRNDLQEQRIGDDLMVYDPRAGKVHVLNGSAALVYGLCDGSHDLDAIVRHLRADFQVPEDRDVRSDVLEAIQALRAKLLLL
jgi:PqqD family protein of HPr-rel-A system